MLSVTKRMDKYLREVFRTYNRMLLQNAKQLEQVDRWLNSKRIMKAMSFEWKVDTCLMKAQIKENVKEISDILVKLREQFKFYESC